MAITAVYTTGALGGTTAGANFTLTPPNSTAAVNNLMVVIVAERSSTDLVTKVADTATGLKTFTKLRFGAQGPSASTGIWYRVLQSGDPGVGNVNTLTLTNTANAEATLLCYAGVDSVTPISAQGTTTSGSTSPITFNGLTTTAVNCMYIGVAAAANVGAWLTSQASGSPSLTERADGGNGGAVSSKSAVGVVDGVIAAAGATGNFTWTVTAAALGTDSFALLPTSAASTPSLYPPTKRPNYGSLLNL